MERVNLYAITGTFILDTEGNRVLSKDHRQEEHPFFLKKPCEREGEENT